MIFKFFHNSDLSIHVHSVRFQYIVAQTVNNNTCQSIGTFVNLKNRNDMIIMKFMKRLLEEGHWFKTVLIW